MKVALITSTYDRNTGERLSTKVIEYREMDEEEYYAPLVELFYQRIMQEYDRDGSKE